MNTLVEVFIGVHPVYFWAQQMLVASAVLSLYIMRRRVRLGEHPRADGEDRRRADDDGASEDQGSRRKNIRTRS